MTIMKDAKDLLKKVYKTDENIITRKILDETILVPIRGKLADMQIIFTLNSVSEYIWDNLNGERTLEDIVNGIKRTFDVKRVVAIEDVSEFIGDLIKENLVTEVG